MPSDSQDLRTSLPVFAEHFPEVAQEIADLLIEEDESVLAMQIPELRVWDRCRCGDSFCSTIYTERRTKIPYSPDHRNLMLLPATGMIILDVIEDKIVCIEILFRDEVRAKLLDLMS